MSKYIIEIKNRFIFLAVCFSSLLVISYYYKEALMFFCIEQNNNQVTDFSFSYFICTEILEVFNSNLQITFFVSSQFTLIFLIYHCFIYLSRGLSCLEYYRYRKLLILILFGWCFSFIVAKYLVFPLSSSFFLDFYNSSYLNLRFEAKLSNYIDLYLTTYLFVLFYFQIFVGFTYFALLNNFSLFQLKTYRKAFYLISAVLATLITPPDVSSQIMLSVLLIIVYEMFYIYIILMFTLSYFFKDSANLVAN